MMTSTRSTTRQLRIATAGSVDDGKSTLIGRLLHDTKTIFEDQLDAVVKASRRYGDQEVNLALLTDGLRAEREQGITIDVAYRYFATPKRSFVLADTPGHAQYTRNMVTGASVSDVSLVLVDARHGVVEQTRRHLGIAAMLGVQHIVLAVNKMDLVEWSEHVYATVVTEVKALLHELRADVALHPVPVSALDGDNVVDRSSNTPWYEGATILDLLESIEVDDEEVHVGARLAVQWTIRAGSDYRAYAGRLTGGSIKVGDDVLILPAGLRSTIRTLTVCGEAADHASVGDAIAVELDDHVDVGRSDVLVIGSGAEPPIVGSVVDLDVCWMIDEIAFVGRHVGVKHLTRHVGATIVGVGFRLDPATLQPTTASSLALNDLGRLTLRLDEVLVADTSRRNRATGHLIVIDDTTNATAAAGTIVAIT